MKQKLTILLTIIMCIALLAGTALATEVEAEPDDDAVDNIDDDGDDAPDDNDDGGDNPFGGWDDGDEPVAGPDDTTPSPDGDTPPEDANEDGDEDVDDDDDADTEPGDAIEIATEDDLHALASAVNHNTFEDTYGLALSKATIKLTNDIELSGSLEPIGVHGAAFTGEFDGGGFTISNVSVNGGEDSTAQGFFGVIGRGGYVHDLNLENVNISGMAYVGGIVGVMEFGRIENCSVQGNINASDSLAGGIAGVAIESTIKSCVTRGAVSAVGENAGGIAGMIAYDNGAIISCSSSSIITAPWGAGGIAGNASNAAIVGCSFSGTLNSSSFAEGKMAGEVETVEEAVGATIEPVFDEES